MLLLLGYQIDLLGRDLIHCRLISRQEPIKGDDPLAKLTDEEIIVVNNHLVLARNNEASLL